MEQDSSTTPQAAALFAGGAWFDPIEASLRARVSRFIEELIEQELEAALGRGRHERGLDGPKGYRHGRRERQLVGSFGPLRIRVPRARLAAEDGGTREWRSAVLPRYARMTRQAEALIAGAYLAGASTRRVKRALAPSSGARWARTWSAALGARCARTGTPGTSAIWPTSRSCA